MTLLREDIDYILRSHLKSHDYEFISCDSSNIEDVSIGFLSAQDKKCIKYRIKDKNEVLHIFIKMLPQSEYHYQNIIRLGGFHREVVLFNSLLNNFNDISIPKCYLARSNDIVVLEDLAHKGFKNKNLYEPFDLLHCEKTLESIAKLHAASFIMEKKEKCKIVELVPVIKNDVIMTPDKNSVGHKAVFASIKGLKKITEMYLAHYPTDLINKAFYYMENLFDKMKSSELYPNVLSHSDLWANNVMFKYDNSGEVIEACLVDFQFATYKPPSYDLQLFLHNCTTREHRDKHYNHLLNHYYNSLAKQLSLTSIDIQDVMSWNNFEGMLKETLPVVISVAPLYIHFILMPADIVSNFMNSDSEFKVYYEEDRTDYILRAMQQSECYKERLLQTMAEFLNYFNSN